MNPRKWFRSNFDYGRKLVTSGRQGASHGRKEFLNGEPLTPFLNESARKALKEATVGACVGVLGGYLGVRSRSKPASRAFAYGVLGGAIGFGAGLTWRTRRLAASIARGALKDMDAVRDEHWLERHPIDYA